MRIKNRLSPYPILDNYGDDYINSSFDVSYDISVQFSEIYGELIFSLDNKEINRLIEEDKAEYVVHVECPLTCYRFIEHSTEPRLEIKLDASELLRKIEMRTFIVLKEDVDGFSSVNFHPDYQNESFNLKKHQIIAIGTAKDYKIQKDDRDLESVPSIIRIKKLKDKKKGALSVNTDNDGYIIIGLAEDLYDIYANLGKHIFKETCFNLVLFPALIIVLQRMYANRKEISYTSMHWYQVIKNILEKNGYGVSDLNIENDMLLSICQSLFSDPLSKAFHELLDCSERME